MISTSQHYHSQTRGEHRSRVLQTRHAVALVAVGAALLGACTLDTEPMSPVTRAPLQADTEVDEAEMEGTSNSASKGAAGAPAELPSPSAAIATAEAQPADDAAAENEDEPEPAQEASAAAASKSAKPTEPTQPMEPAEEAKLPAEDEDAKPMAAADERLDKSRCRPGKYTGVINGNVTLTGLIAVGTMSGTIDLELVPYKGRTDVLTVRNGRVAGVDDKQSKFSADLTGLVNCATGEVVKTSVERGLFEDQGLDIQVGFAGAAKGQYSMNPPALNGTWQISDDTLLLAGEGTWSARMSEPY